jgi:Fic family protein
MEKSLELTNIFAQKNKMRKHCLKGRRTLFFGLLFYLNLSYDTIMKPSYTITTSILNLVASISLKIGEASAHYLDKKSPKLRKANRIKTIQATLGIEGNSLSKSQVQAIDEGKVLIGFERDQKEVQNALTLYDRWNEFKHSKSASFLSAHRILMHELISNPGEYRNRSVGITKGKTLTHIAPPGKSSSLFNGRSISVCSGRSRSSFDQKLCVSL